MSDTGAGANFNNLIDALPFGVRVLYDNGELLYANQAFLNVSGCGSVEELQSLPNLGAEERQSQEWIYKESERLNSIIDDFLNVSRIETGMLKINPGKISLATLISGVMSRCR